MYVEIRLHAVVRSELKEMRFTNRKYVLVNYCIIKCRQMLWTKSIITYTIGCQTWPDVSGSLSLS